MGIISFIIGVFVGILVSYYILDPIFGAEEIQPTYIISKVVRVIDGDTIVLETNDKIRLSIVNTPERGEVGYYEAKSFTESLCLDKQAFVDIDDGQRYMSYDRLVGAVYCQTPENDYYLNLALLKTGNAVIMEKYCSVSEFAMELCYHK